MRPTPILVIASCALLERSSRVVQFETKALVTSISCMASSFFRSTRANQPSRKQRRWPAARANHTCENLTLDSLSGAAKLSDLWRIFGSLDFCVLWLAEMPSAESGAILSRPSVNFEPAFDQELLSIVRTCP